MPSEASLNSIMGDAAFTRLDELCRGHPQMFAHASSPEETELYEFQQNLLDLSYVKGMMEGGYVRRAIEMLEKGFSPRIDISKPEVVQNSAWRALKARKRREREVRFIHRLAVIAGPVDRSLPLNSPKDDRANRPEAIRALRKAVVKLGVIMSDEFLREALEPASSIRLLFRLQSDLPKAIAAIQRATPKYPSERIRDEKNSQMNQMVNRVADSCYRLYALLQQGNPRQTASVHLVDPRRVVRRSARADVGGARQENQRLQPPDTRRGLY